VDAEEIGFLAQLRTAGFIVIIQAALGALTASPAVEITLSSVVGGRTCDPNMPNTVKDAENEGAQTEENISVKDIICYQDNVRRIKKGFEILLCLKLKFKSSYSENPRIPCIYPLSDKQNA
jgi:hypothetical protein